jgi:protein-disulfide isomerase
MAQQTGKWRQRLGWVLAALLLTGAGGAWYALDLGFQSARAETDAAADEFGQRVREYLLAHPEVIVEAMQVFEARRLQDEEDEARAVLAARADEVFRDPDSPVGGNAKGDVTMVEFFDYTVPIAARLLPSWQTPRQAMPGCGSSTRNSPFSDRVRFLRPGPRSQLTARDATPRSTKH